ncbi:MAG: penicillin-binding protein 1C [Halobacteriovoraceae bacterium]|nr:penicillin-binding protein 1C [Halobacteriovoraceae bacterium]
MYPIKSFFTYSKAIYSKDNQLLRMTLSEDEQYRLWADLKDIPIGLQETFLLKEDQYFKYHIGFNPISLLKAFNVSYLRGERMVGASTITMQLARLIYNLQTRTIIGKLKQILISLGFELIYSKDQILEAYLNFAPFGRNIVGVSAASLIYFKKPITQLSLNEHLFLSVIPQNPSALNSLNELGSIPIEIYHKKVKLSEKWHVLQKDGKKFNAKNVERNNIYSTNNIPFLAPHFTDFIIGKEFKENSIETTLNLKIQNKVDAAVKNYIHHKRSIGIKNAAAIVVNYNTMEIETLVGSADFFDNQILGQNNGVFAKRSPGSTLKPFLYALGFERGIIFPKSIMYDIPLTFKTPRNFDEKFRGAMTSEVALITSRNVPAVWLYSKIKNPNFFAFLKSTGVIEDEELDIYGSSLVLGGKEMSLLDLSKLYSILGNQGKVREIKWKKDNIESASTEVLSPQAVAMLMNVLANNPRPSSGMIEKFTKRKHEVYWKTGTSFGLRDAWSIGLYGPYVVGVWVGNFDGQGNPYFIGHDTASPLFFDIVDKLKNFVPDNFIDLKQDSYKLSHVDVCSKSGMIPTKNCKSTVSSLYLPGVSSIQKCNVHRKIKINKKTKLRACSTTNDSIEEKIVEVWPSKILEIQKNIGLPLKELPSYSNECKISDRVLSDNDPVILSPQHGIDYHIRVNDDKNLIPLSAKVDSDVRNIFWYVDEEFLGKTSPLKPLFWKGVSGQHLVKVVDDQGRHSQREMNISVSY